MMKRMIAAVCAAAMAVSLTACSHMPDAASEKYKDAVDYPDVASSDYVTLTDEYQHLKLMVEPKHEVTSEELNEQAEAYVIEGVGYAKEKDMSVTDESVLEVSYTADIDGKADKQLASTGHRVLDMTDDTVPPEFVQALMTMHTGETKDVTLVLPDDYPAEDYCGKTVNYHLTLHYVLFAPDVTDDNVARASKGSIRTVDELKENLKQSGEKYYEDTYQQNVYDSVFTALEQCAEVAELPDTIIDWYVHSQMHFMYLEASRYDLTLTEYVEKAFSKSVEDFETEFRENAAAAVKMEMIFRTIAEKEGLTVTDDVYQKYAEKLTNVNGFESVEDMQESVPDDIVRANVLIEMVMDWLIDHADVVPAVSED